jgi:hypothetical protein
MLLFWDPANTLPSDWCVLTAYDGYFPRGSSPANFGTKVNTASRPYTPSTSANGGSVSVSGPSTTLQGSGGGGPISAATHTHPTPTVTLSADNNGDASNPDIPAFRSLQLIMYKGANVGCTGAGIPNTIPTNSIAMFASAPSGSWTQYSAQNGKLTRVNSTMATGGADSLTNTITMSSLGAADNTSTTRFCVLGCANAAGLTHTHTAPTSVTCTSGCSSSSCPSFVCTVTNVVPSYIQPLFYQATANNSTLSLNIIAMFDGDPGTGWVMLSNGGGTTPDFTNRFIRPNSSAVLTPQGNDSRTQTYSGVTGQANSTSNTSNNLNADAAATTHTHTITGTTESISNIPPYFNVVIAEKVNFTLSQYQWYVDNNVYTETDQWPSGALNVAPHSQIPAIPAPYIPPDDNQQLRVRVQITVSGQALAANSVSFKLQYNKGTATDCLSGSWQDVDDHASTNGRSWRYGAITGAGVSDGGTLPSVLLSSTQPENFYESASTGAGFTNPNAALTGQTIEYDWVIQDHGATGGSQYNFRVVENPGTLDNGTLLSVYTFCPSLITRPTTDQLLRHGEFFQDGSDQGFIWVD